MRVSTVLAVPLLLLSILVSGQLVSAHVGTPLSAPGRYTLRLQAQSQDTDGNVVTKIISSMPKSMTLDISKDSQSLTFRFQWSHMPGLGASADHYLFVMGFDLNNNGVWQDVDNDKYTIDDALVLSYLSFDVVIGCEPGPWICFKIDKGFRVHSWDSTNNNFQEVYGPGNDVPGPLYPIVRTKVNVQNVAADPSTKNGMVYSYSLTFKVPSALFMRLSSMSGFGFGLV